MKTIRIIALITAFNTMSPAIAMVGPVSFEQQMQRADTVARIVVIEVAKLEYTKQEEWTFTGMAKCRVVTDYTGKLLNRDFVYIPCDYTFDESPSPLEVGKDYIIFLNLLSDRSVAHPVSSDAAHEVSGGMLSNPEHKDPDARTLLEVFEKEIRSQWKLKLEKMYGPQGDTKTKSDSANEEKAKEK